VSIPLSESNSGTLDDDGNATVQLGPTGGNEVWTPSSVSVICSSNASEANCAVYAGPTATAQYFKDLSVDGSTGDATDRCNVTIRKGSYVWAVWTGGDPGAACTVNVDGAKTGS